jgi:hypothetical protein
VEFFGLWFDWKKKPPLLAPLPPSKKRKPDDIGIEHFKGLQRVTPEEFLKVTKLDEPTLREVYEGANKQLAHFTTTELKFDPEQTEQVAHGIIKAFQVLLYGALGERQPKMLLEKHEK